MAGGILTKTLAIMIKKQEHIERAATVLECCIPQIMKVLYEVRFCCSTTMLA
jgi:hypothetical protein